MHIHFWWGYINTFVPSLLGVDCSWCSWQTEKVWQCWKITPGLHAHSGSHWRVRMVMFGERNQGCWRYGGTAWAAAAAGPGCDLQHGRFLLAFGLRGTGHTSSLLLLRCGTPSFHLCFPAEHDQPMLGSAHPGALLQPLPACQFLAVPDIPALLQWHLCPSLLQKGVAFYSFPI